MDRVWQEFYCNDCHGYILVKLNMALNHSVEVKCPNCGRKHPRTIRNGVIAEDVARGTPEEICPPKSAYSKEPFSKGIRPHSRTGNVINGENDVRDPASDAIIKERWFEIFGGRR